MLRTQISGTLSPNTYVYRDSSSYIISETPPSSGHNNKDEYITMRLTQFPESTSENTYITNDGLVAIQYSEGVVIVYDILDKTNSKFTDIISDKTDLTNLSVEDDFNKRYIQFKYNGTNPISIILNKKGRFSNKYYFTVDMDINYDTIDGIYSHTSYPTLTTFSFFYKQYYTFNIYKDGVELSSKTLSNFKADTEYYTFSISDILQTGATLTSGSTYLLEVI